MTILGLTLVPTRRFLLKACISFSSLCSSWVSGMWWKSSCIARTASPTSRPKPLPFNRWKVALQFIWTATPRKGTSCHYCGMKKLGSSSIDSKWLTWRTWALAIGCRTGLRMVRGGRLVCCLFPRTKSFVFHVWGSGSPPYNISMLMICLMAAVILFL